MNIREHILHNDYTPIPSNIGANNNDGFAKVGYQMSRKTFDGGIHDHRIEGNSNNSNAILTGTGGNQAFDNRSLYTVVQYIIYIQN